LIVESWIIARAFAVRLFQKRGSGVRKRSGPRRRALLNELDFKEVMLLGDDFNEMLKGEEGRRGITPLRLKTE